MSFENLKKMAEQMKLCPITNDEAISYVDICMPVPLLQVHTLNTFNLIDTLYIKTQFFFNTKHNV